jgi:hypothetical protein
MAVHSPHDVVRSDVRQCAVRSNEQRGSRPGQSRHGVGCAAGSDARDEDEREESRQMCHAASSISSLESAQFATARAHARPRRHPRLEFETSRTTRLDHTQPPPRCARSKRIGRAKGYVRYGIVDSASKLCIRSLPSLLVLACDVRYERVVKKATRKNFFRVAFDERCLVGLPRHQRDHRHQTP